jgi:DNA-binding NarL/FixJ family response regulator
MPEVGLGIGRGIGTYEGWTREWLYWYDQQGQRLLTPEESLEQELQQAQQMRQRAEQAELQLNQERQQVQQSQQQAIAQLLSLGLSVEQIAGALGLSVQEVKQAIAD